MKTKRMIFVKMPTSTPWMFSTPEDGQEVDIYPDNEFEGYWVIVGFERNRNGQEQIFISKCFRKPQNLSEKLVSEFMEEDQKTERIDVPERVFTTEAKF